MLHPRPAHTHPHHADHEHGKPVIRFDHASFWYPHGPALEDITLEIADGEFIGVIGPNGSGKTTAPGSATSHRSALWIRTFRSPYARPC